MGLSKIRLGDYIERSTSNNKDLKFGTELITGVNNNGIFASPKGNPEGVDLKPYKIVNNGAFVYNPTRLNLGSIAYRTQGLCIVSHLYNIFYLTHEGLKTINPLWLYIYFRRNEFYREVTFRNFGSQRPEFSFSDMSDIIIPLPPLDIQQKYVDVYNAMIANQQCYERGLEDLKLVCDAYIEELRRKMPSESIGKYIKLLTKNNIDSKITYVQGVESSGSFMDTKANMQGVDIEKYTVVNKGNFAYNPSRINIGSIAMYREENPCIVSPMYIVFEIVDSNALIPEYLMLWLSRKEFQRFTWFYAAGSVRDTFDYNLMETVKIPIPNIKIQQDIVDIYKVYLQRKEINERLKEQIKSICPILIKGSLEEARKKEV